MSRRGSGRARRIGTGALLIWCLLFLRCETTEQSMVRAVMLERSPQGWTAGLIYQAPEASADSSEAVAEVRFAAAEDETLAKALAAAEKALPQKANYRLCDYLLLAQGARMDLLDEYEQLVLAQQCGRISARVLSCGFSCSELSEQSEEVDALPEALLQCVKNSAAAAPHLYDRRAGCLMPRLVLTEEDAAPAEEGVFLSASGELLLDAAQTSAARLLAGAGETYTFWLDGRRVTLRCRGRAVQPEADGSFTIELDCQSAAGAQPPDAVQCEALEQLCARTVRAFWDRGIDLAGLGAAKALRSIRTDSLEPAKNVCPEVRTDVRLLFDF